MPLTGSQEQECRIEATTFIYKNISLNKLPYRVTMFRKHNFLITQMPQRLKRPALKNLLGKTTIYFYFSIILFSGPKIIMLLFSVSKKEHITISVGPTISRGCKTRNAPGCLFIRISLMAMSETKAENFC